MDISKRKSINISGNRVVVIGLGRSGSGAAKLAHFLGADVLISDPSTTDSVFSQAEELTAMGIKTETGGHSQAIYNADLMVVSPGVPRQAECIRHAQKNNIPVVGEIEFASWFTQAPIIAVTGSNGKTTTVHILANMCQSDQVRGVLAGNVGSAFSHHVMAELQSPDPQRVYILEISSFQMEFILHFRPKISVFLNISPDHLDRHGTMEEYIDAKLNMMSNLTEDDWVIYNEDDPLLNHHFTGMTLSCIPFSIEKSSNMFSCDDQVYFKQEPFIRFDEITLPGPHNLANLIAAGTAASLIGINKEQLRDVFSTFKAIAHRMEKVARVDDVEYINDSKATNVDAVKVALQSYSQPIILILGGKDKGGDFAQLLPHTHNVKTVLAYGQARDLIAAALADAVRLSTMESLKDAVHLSHELARPGDIVLLSPGCASFDQFNGYEERGDKFKTWANELGKAA